LGDRNNVRGKVLKCHTALTPRLNGGVLTGDGYTVKRPDSGADDSAKVFADKARDELLKPRNCPVLAFGG
jgi:hypothetical protein